eukprot:9005431-Alexandrium_andersonii.AAC.2
MLSGGAVSAPKCASARTSQHITCICAPGTGLERIHGQGPRKTAQPEQPPRARRAAPKLTSRPKSLAVSATRIGLSTARHQHVRVALLIFRPALKPANFPKDATDLSSGAGAKLMSCQCAMQS